MARIFIMMMPQASPKGATVINLGDSTLGEGEEADTWRIMGTGSELTLTCKNKHHPEPLSK